MSARDAVDLGSGSRSASAWRARSATSTMPRGGVGLHALRALPPEEGVGHEYGGNTSHDARRQESPRRLGMSVEAAVALLLEYESPRRLGRPGVTECHRVDPERARAVQKVTSTLRSEDRGRRRRSRGSHPSPGQSAHHPSPMRRRAVGSRTRVSVSTASRVPARASAIKRPSTPHGARLPRSKARRSRAHRGRRSRPPRGRRGTARIRSRHGTVSPLDQCGAVW